MKEKEEKVYEGRQLPEIQVSTSRKTLPYIHQDTFGNVYSINKFGQRILHDTKTFDSTGTINLSAENFEKARLYQAKMTDINNTHRFSDMVKDFTTGLVTGTGAEEIIAGPIILGIRFIGSKIFKKLPRVAKAVFTPTGSTESLYTPDELINNGMGAKGAEHTAKFFEHPVGQESYKHNLELAKRFGITIPDKNAAEVVRKPITFGYKKLDENTLAQIHHSHFGDPDAKIIMDWNYHPWEDMKKGIVHEYLHRGYYSAPLRPNNMTKSYYDNIFKPEYKFWEMKTKKLLKPEYWDSYLMLISDGEAGANFIDLGSDLGLKLGLKYPGYETVKAMLDNYKGFKRFMIPQLNDSKAGMRHVWDAMTGRYFTPIIGTSLIGTTLINK